MTLSHLKIKKKKTIFKREVVGGWVWCEAEGGGVGEGIDSSERQC